MEPGITTNNSGLGSSAFTKSLRSLVLGTVALTGCFGTDQNAAPPQNDPTQAAAPAPVPEPETVTSITTTGKEVVETLDWNNLSKVNNGFNADMNADGVVDHAMMRGNDFFFSKGNPQGGYAPEVRIAHVEGEVVAYRVDTIPAKGVTLPSLIFFDPQGRGYVQVNQGANEKGIPILLEPEILEFPGDTLP